MACIGLINGYRRCTTAPKCAPKTVKKRHEITSYTARYGENHFYDARYILLLLCKPDTIYSGFDTKYALDMYRKSAYNRKYRKRKAKALRLCRRGETEREVKRMIRYIVKRSGDKVSFDARKIKSAIFKANTRIAAERMSDADLNELTEEVLTALEKLPGTPTAQEIQNVVEEKLLAADYAKTANAYINYRTEHEHLREMDDELVKIFENLTFRPSEEDDLKRENANINADTAMGTMLKYGSESAKAFYDKYVIPPEIAEAHASGDIHIHDKDFYALTETCCQIDLLKLFQDGFSTGHGYLREPNDIRSYAALACIAIQANQNEMHGGQSVPNFDYAMAEGVKKTYRKQYFRALAQYIEVRFDMSASDAAALTAAIKKRSAPMSQCTPQKLTPKSCARFCRAIKQKTASRSSRETLPVPPRNTPQRPPTKRRMLPRIRPWKRSSTI